MREKPPHWRKRFGEVVREGQRVCVETLRDTHSTSTDGAKGPLAIVLGKYAGTYLYWCYELKGYLVGVYMQSQKKILFFLHSPFILSALCDYLIKYDKLGSAMFLSC